MKNFNFNLFKTKIHTYTTKLFKLYYKYTFHFILMYFNFIVQ